MTPPIFHLLGRGLGQSGSNLKLGAAGGCALRDTNRTKPRTKPRASAGKERFRKEFESIDSHYALATKIVNGISHIVIYLQVSGLQRMHLSRRRSTVICAVVAVLFGGGLVTFSRLSAQAPAADAAVAAPTPRVFFDTYCITCHNQKLKTAGLMLDTLDLSKPGAHEETLEKVIAKLRAGSMPPPGMPRAKAATYSAVASALEDEVDQAWAAHPNPGRIGAVQRLNASEYNNAIRDLFALDMDVKPLLPGDDTADGSFDNFADSLSISTAHLERYMSVARQVTRLATGLPPAKPNLETFEIPLHELQDDRMSEDLPFGSRGGLAVHYDFPVDGEYLIKVRLQRQYQDYLKGMGWPQQLDIRLDGKLLKRFTVGGEAKGRPAAASYAGDGEPGFAGDPSWETYMQLTGDAGLEVRIPVKAGSRVVGVSFVRELWEPEGLPQPLQLGRVIANDQVYMGNANVGSVQIGGPYEAPNQASPAKDTASRRAIFVCQPPKVAAEQRSCAATILSRMARLAYRRPVDQGDVDTLLQFYDQGRQDGGSFDNGIQFALERMLVDPDFLLRVYRDPAKATYGQLSPQRSGIGLAAVVLPVEQHPGRSSADAGRTRRTHQSADSRKGSAAHAGRSARHRCAGERFRGPVVESAPGGRSGGRSDQVSQLRLEPAAGVREGNRDVCGQHAARGSHRGGTAGRRLHLRQRTARAAYGIPGVYGSRFRRVTLPNHDQRGGLLAQGCDAGDHFLSRPHLAGAARQMAAEQYFRNAHSAAAAGSEHDARDQTGRAAADHARKAGAASDKSYLQ